MIQILALFWAMGCVEFIILWSSAFPRGEPLDPPEIAAAVILGFVWPMVLVVMLVAHIWINSEDE